MKFFSEIGKMENKKSRLDDGIRRRRSGGEMENANQSMHRIADAADRDGHGDEDKQADH